MDIKYIKNVSDEILSIEGVSFAVAETQDVYYDATIFGNRAGDVCEYYTRDLIELYDGDSIIISDKQVGFDLINYTVGIIANGASTSATSLSELTDVSLESLAEGQALVRNEAEDTWENIDAEPVELTSPQEGDVIKYVGGEWVNSPAGSDAGASTNMRYMKYFSTGTQLPSWADSAPLMMDVYGNPCSLNGGYQNDMSAIAGASFTAFPITKVLISLSLRPYNVGAGNPAPVGSTIVFTVHLVETEVAQRVVHEEIEIEIDTLEALNQSNGQAMEKYSTVTLDHTLVTPIPANSFIGPSVTVSTLWGVIGNMFLTITYKEA